MRKRDELTNPNSCLSRSLDNEIVFVILGRDPEAPDTIRDWASRRVAMGLNQRNDPQIVEALRAARLMHEERDGVIEEVFRRRNARRHELIKRNVYHNDLTPAEAEELEKLQKQCGDYLDKKYPADPALEQRIAAAEARLGIVSGKEPPVSEEPCEKTIEPCNLRSS